MSQFYSSLGCFYPSGTTGRVVSSNTVTPMITHVFIPWILRLTEEAFEWFQSKFWSHAPLSFHVNEFHYQMSYLFFVTLLKNKDSLGLHNFICSCICHPVTHPSFLCWCRSSYGVIQWDEGHDLRHCDDFNLLAPGRCGSSSISVTSVHMFRLCSWAINCSEVNATVIISQHWFR